LTLFKNLTETQVWKSLFRHKYPDNARDQALAVLSNVFLHLHPIKVRKSGVRMSYTWCMGGITFFLFLVETITGVLLMFYYRPTVEFAFNDIKALREHVPTIMVVDDELPDGRGGDLVRELMANPRTSHVRVVFCTAAGPSRRREIAQLAPVIEKPFRVREMERALHEAAAG